MLLRSMRAIPCLRNRENCPDNTREHYTDHHRAGGVIVVGTGGRIDINNTFEERLKLLENDGLPTIRAILFGENKNRKFRD